MKISLSYEQRLKLLSSKLFLERKLPTEILDVLKRVHVCLVVIIGKKAIKLWPV